MNKDCRPPKHPATSLPPMRATGCFGSVTGRDRARLRQHCEANRDAARHFHAPGPPSQITDDQFDAIGLTSLTFSTTL